MSGILSPHPTIFKSIGVRLDEQRWSPHCQVSKRQSQLRFSSKQPPIDLKMMGRGINAPRSPSVRLDRLLAL